MPNPHLRVQVISRAGGRSAVAAAAYRSGEVLTASPSVVGMASYRAGEYLGDVARGETFDYTRKEGVEWSRIFAPEGAPQWVQNRGDLWNAVEAAEVRKDARLAREIEASLPREASPEQWREMVGELAGHFTRHGLVVDVSIHNVKARDGGMNPHAHFLIADRPVDADGFRASKTSVRFLNGDQALKDWREAWEGISNRALEAAGSEARLSLQSYAARGIDKTPTKPLGPKASALEKQGIATPRGDENRRIMAENALREELRRLNQTDSSADGRGAWFDSFSYQFGGSMDAARDAVHRFRAKDAEKDDTMSDDDGSKWRRLIDPERFKREQAAQQKQEPTATSTQAASQTPAPPAGTAQGSSLGDGLRRSGAILDQKMNPAASAPASERETQASAAALNAAAQAKTQGSQQVNHLAGTSGADLGTLPLQPTGDTGKEPIPTQRYQGMTLDGHDSPRQGPERPPQGAGMSLTQGGTTAGNKQAAPLPSSHADSEARLTPANEREMIAAAAALNAQNNPVVSQVRATNLQQNHATLQQGAQDTGPKQSEQRQQGAAIGGQAQAGANKDAVNAFLDRVGGKPKETDKSQSKQKDQTREQGRDDR